MKLIKHLGMRCSTETSKTNKKFRDSIRVNRKQIHLGRFDTAVEAGKAYDKYVLDNNLEHTLNGVLNV